MPTSLSHHLQDLNGSELGRLARLYQLPETIKQADFNQIFDTKRRVQHWADPRNKSYCCDTGVDTLLSALYFMDKQANMQPLHRQMVEGQIHSFAQFHGVMPELESLRKQAAALSKSGSSRPDEQFAVVFQEPGTDVTHRHLPIGSSTEVKRAAEWMDTYGRKLPFTKRAEAATRILEAAQLLGVALSASYTDKLEKLAGHGVCDPDEVVQQLQMRVNRCVKSAASLRPAAERLLSAIKKDPQRTLAPDTLMKLAETLDDIDNGLGVRYEGGILPPEDFLFSATFTKAANEIQNLCRMTTGTIYEKTSLDKVPAEKLAELFGDAFVSEAVESGRVSVEKLAELLETLPRGDADVFDSLMSELSIKPVLMKRGGYHPLNEVDIQQLASQYIGK